MHLRRPPPIANIYNEYQNITTQLYAKLNAMAADIKNDGQSSYTRNFTKTSHYYLTNKELTYLLTYFIVKPKVGRMMSFGLIKKKKSSFPFAR